jgi:Uma2 family endonuclease
MSPRIEGAGMSTVAQTRITAEQFARLPEPLDGSKQELVKGVIITMPPPGGRHGACFAKIARVLGNHVDSGQLGHVTSNDTGFILERGPDTVRGPDVSFWSRARLPELSDEYVAIAPDLAIEVISPGDHFGRVQKKIAQYQQAGVVTTWIVDPDDRSVTVYRLGQPPVILDDSDTLVGDGVLSDFRCLVHELLI